MNSRASLIAHAARGPILLITLGVLAAMHQAGAASLAHTWPLLIIVLGVIKLIERILAPRVPYGMPGAAYTAQQYGRAPYGQPPFPQPPPPGVPRV